MSSTESKDDSGLRARLARILASRYFYWFVLTASLLACAPVLNTGLATDDWLHLLYSAPSAQIEGLDPRPWDLFRFADGVPEHNHALIESGFYPWWTDLQAKIRFFRPLSVFFHRIDSWLWPDRVQLMHLHSLAWFGLALLAVGATYRRWLQHPSARWGGAVSGLAFFLFALDDARGPTLGWIANRNALISLCAGTGTLWLHARAFQSDARRWDRLWALALWCGALAAGESGLGALAYLAGFVLFIQKGPLRSRVLSFAPYFGIALAYLAIRHELGYGVFSSDFYIDPLQQPIRYLQAALTRVPMLLSSCLAGIWSDIPAGDSFFFPEHKYFLAGGSALISILVIWLGWKHWRNDPASRAMGLGLFGNLLLCATTFPGDRVLGLAGLGASALLAQAIWGSTAAVPAWGLRRIAGWILFFIHGIAAPAFLPARVRSMEYASRPIMHVHTSLPDQNALMDHTLILVNPPSDAQVSYFVAFRLAQGLALPASLRWLGAGSGPWTVSRLDERTLRMVNRDGFLNSVSERMMHSIHRPFHVGQEIELTNLRITIETLTPDARPLQVRFTFEHPLEDPRYLWAKWEGKGFVTYQPPRIGAPDQLPAQNLMLGLDPLPTPLPPTPSLHDWLRQPATRAE